MRITLSTPRRPGRARATRRPRSSRIGAVAGASLAMANQIASPMVDVRAGVQAAGEVASTRPVTEFGQAVISHMQA